MPPSPLHWPAFRRACRRYRLLAWALFAGAVALLAGSLLLAPFAPDHSANDAWRAALLQQLPALCYLIALPVIGHGIGRLAQGRLIQPVLASSLRYVGLALLAGCLASTLLVTNLARMLGYSTGGYVHFDIAGITLGMVGAGLLLLGRVIEHAVRQQAELDGIL